MDLSLPAADRGKGIGLRDDPDGSEDRRTLTLAGAADTQIMHNVEGTEVHTPASGRGKVTGGMVTERGRPLCKVTPGSGDHGRLRHGIGQSECRSVLYRALWSDGTETDRRSLVSLARACFCTWATGDPESTLPGGETVVGAKNVTLRTVDGEGIHGIEGVSLEAPTGDRDVETVWTTRMRVVALGDRVHFWVENSMETDDLTQRVQVGRPRLVDELLSLPGQHMLGASLVYTDAEHHQTGPRPIPDEIHLISSLRS